MAEMVLPMIKDQHNRFKIIEHFKSDAQSLLTRMHANLGQAMFFNFWNPSGHYDLNLTVPEQRAVANVILLLNKLFAAKVKTGEYKDRSQKGNASCLRNEKVSGGHFVWTPDYILPKMGNFQFDFVYMTPNRPSAANATPEDQLISLMGWFHEKYERFKQECESANVKVRFDADAFADCFAAISDFLSINTLQLLSIMDIIDGKSLAR